MTLAQARVGEDLLVAEIDDLPLTSRRRGARIAAAFHGRLLHQRDLPVDGTPGALIELTTPEGERLHRVWCALATSGGRTLTLTYLDYGRLSSRSKQIPAPLARVLASVRLPSTTAVHQPAGPAAVAEWHHVRLSDGVVVSEPWAPHHLRSGGRRTLITAQRHDDGVQIIQVPTRIGRPGEDIVAELNNELDGGIVRDKRSTYDGHPARAEELVGHVGGLRFHEWAYVIDLDRSQLGLVYFRIGPGPRHLATPPVLVSMVAHLALTS